MGTRRILVAPAISLILATLLSAQPSQQNRYKLEGTVINSVTGKPLARALVEAFGHVMLTGPEGEFSFDGLSAGSVQVRASKPGYFVHGANPSGYSLGPVFKVGPDAGKCVLKLAPEAIITGRVTGKDDEPLEGVAVQALTYWSMNDEPARLMQAGNPVLTDEDGNFRIAGLVPGYYYVIVRTDNFARRFARALGQQPALAYPPLVYYPGVSDLAAASPIRLIPGQHAEVPFSLTPGPAFKVSGTVVAAGSWKHVNPPMIVDGMGQGTLMPEVVDASTGAFEFHAVPAGTYSLRVSGTDADNRYQFSDRKLTVANTVVNLKAVLKQGVAIPVVVRAEYTKPRAKGAGVCTQTLPSGQSKESDCSDYPAAGVELIATDRPNVQFSTEFKPVSDSEGLAIHGVAPGKYLVRARAIFGGYVESLRSGRQDLLREELTVGDGGNISAIEVVVRDDPAVLNVRLHNEIPGQPATVVVFAEGALIPASSLRGSTVTDSFSGQLAPGSYNVFAFDSDNIDYGSPTALAKYAARAAHVTVSASHESSVTVDVIHVEE